MKFIKIILFFIFFIFFINGCSSNRISMNNVNKLETKNDFILGDYYTDDTSTFDNVLNTTNELFNNNNYKEKEDLTNIDDEVFFNNGNIEYSSLKTVYKYVLNNENLNNYNLKDYDYLYLYKALKLNQPKIFKNMKKEIINRFMIEIEDNGKLDFNKIYLTLLEENLTKINILIKILKNENNIQGNYNEK